MQHPGAILTNSSIGSQSSLPRPTSIEAILHTPSTAAADDMAADPRLGLVGDWTRVTDDTGFLAHLVTIWTEREYIYYHFLDRDAFLADLSSRRSDFCSELLVNVLLASACVSTSSRSFTHRVLKPEQFHSSAVKNRNKPLSESSIQTSFYYEARRLWDLENGKDSLTKVQAGMIFCTSIFQHHSSQNTRSTSCETRTDCRLRSGSCEVRSR